MTEFVDTNIVLYGFDSDAGPRQEQSIGLLSRLSLEVTGTISVQVLVEFYANATRKYRMPDAEVEEAIADFWSWSIHRPDYSSVIAAIQLQRRYRLQWFDAMILNSALEMECSILWTEDFQDGQRFGNLVVRNPYKNLKVV